MGEGRYLEREAFLSLTAFHDEMHCFEHPRAALVIPESKRSMLHRLSFTVQPVSRDVFAFNHVGSGSMIEPYQIKQQTQTHTELGEL